MNRITTIASRLKTYRELHNMTLTEMGARTGIPAQTLNRYELGQRAPKIDVAVQIAEALSINPLWLQGFNVQMEIDKLPAGAVPYNPTHKIPLLGQIAAGLPLYAEQNIEGYIWTERNHGKEYFALRVRGDSMNAAGIKDGDIIVVRQQPKVDDGQIAVVLVDEEATVKRYHQQGDTIILSPQSTNPAHQPQLYSLRNHSVKVLGIVLESRTEIR